MLPVLVYSSFLFFATMLLCKFIRLRERIHLRCDLYPAPQSKPYGGSRYEEVEWWKKEIRKPYSGILKAFIGFALINRRKMSLQPCHWLATFLFHLGIFLHVLWLLIMLLSALFSHPISHSEIIGISGLLLMLLFSPYLLIRKLRTPVRYYVPLEDYLVLLLVIAVSSSGVMALLKIDFLHVYGVFSAIIFFSELPQLEFFETLHIVTFSLLLFLLPFTRVTHYVAVLFTHLVLWDDRDAGEVQKLSTARNSRVKWANCADPELSWEEIARR
jgi:nitrate reductase gamma subunit